MRNKSLRLPWIIQAVVVQRKQPFARVRSEEEELRQEQGGVPKLPGCVVRFGRRRRRRRWQRP